MTDSDHPIRQLLAGYQAAVLAKDDTSVPISHETGKGPFTKP